MTGVAPRRDRGRAVPAPSVSTVPWLLRGVNQRYRRATAAALAQGGYDDLPQPGYWALMALDAGATDAGELVAAMGTTKQAVSKLVDALVDAHYVERRTNADDRRRTDLLLSPRGRAAVGVIAAAVHRTEQQFVAELGARRFAELAAMLERLA